MKINNILIIFLSTVFLLSCQGTKDAFTTKKRSGSSEEFLVQKKTPLTTPPDINELPVPLDEQEYSEEGVSDDLDIKKILEIDQEQSENQDSSTTNSSLENSILEKISN